MRAPLVADVVELKQDLASEFLHAGEKEKVCNVWFKPDAVYEAEFRRVFDGLPIRALLQSEQLRLMEDGTTPREN